VKSTISLLFLYYLRFFARLQLVKIKLLLSLQNKKLTIIGVTGSAGKTSTILALEAILKPSLRVKATHGTNSESGIPLDILDLKIGNYTTLNWFFLALITPFAFLFNWTLYDIYIVEMGIDSPKSPKNMDYLLTILKPNIGIFLNVNPVHAQFFSSLNQLAQEKVKLINSLPSSGTALINTSDSLVKKYLKTQAKIIPIKTQKITLKTPLPNIYQFNLSTSIQVGSLFNIPPKTAIHNLNHHFYLPKSRSTILPGINNSTIIDSSYNSSPTACLAMLDFLATFPSPRIAILGDMRELGQHSTPAHRQIYQKASKIADTIISIGPQTKKHFGSKAHKFLYWWQAFDYLKSHPKLISKSQLLIKGSQNNIFLEELVKSLLKNPSDAQKLCRQSPYWLSLKKKFRQQRQ